MISTTLENSELCVRTCPMFHDRSGLWLYGNTRLLAGSLAFVRKTIETSHPLPKEIQEIERGAEDLVLAGKILVVGIHNVGQMQAAVVPLRWGAPRVLVLSGGFYYHLGEKLNQEPFSAAKLWRYQFDANTDLVVSRRAPDKKPTFSLHNPTIDKLIVEIAEGRRQELTMLIPTVPVL